MIDGDVIFDASWIKRWQEEYAFLMGVPIANGTATGAAPSAGPVPLALAEVISPIMAMKHGYGLPVPPPGTLRAAAMNAAILGNNRGPDGTPALAVDVVPSGWDPIQAQLSQPLEPGPARHLQLRCRQVPRDALRHPRPGDARCRPPPTKTRRRTRT